MRVLKLVLKSKWFDMILSGEKKEEYRELKPFYHSRFLTECEIDSGNEAPLFKEYDSVELYRGYAKNRECIQVECLGISIGPCKPEWSDNAQGHYYIVSLGKIQRIYFQKS